jgi:phosphohistidine phosphatase SixA
VKKPYHAITETPNGNVITCRHNPFLDEIVIEWNVDRASQLRIPVAAIPVLLKILADAHRATTEPQPWEDLGGAL